MQKQLLQDNENIQGDGKPNRFAANEGTAQASVSAEPPTTFLDWMGIFGMMFFTYLTIIVLWLLCMFGVRQNFEATIISFMVIFIGYVCTVAYFWSQGLKQREALINQYIEEKSREAQMEIGLQ